ncbi:Uma2 family endonuclease, partial [Candidatus Viridilinea mediisalina]|uniref:Uma2 family endonuclease n=1 Tax=Candidatus Viridilinea mediisalina TaxID=2024553 RepID=UPI0010541BA9
MTVQPHAQMNAAAYLAFERAATQRHEYVDGSVRAMSGASVAHNIIVGNIFARLHQHTLAQGCTVFASDMRLGLVEQESYFYPDIMVVCGDLQCADTQQDTLLNPILIVEVLSPSTEQYDRGKKSHYYRSIPSLREYLLIAQDQAYLEHVVRYGPHQWLITEITDQQAEIHLVSVDYTLRLQDVYAKVVRR